MPPKRRSKRASQKECDERLSIAETIAGLANSIEQPAFSPVGVISRQNSCDNKSSANLTGLPSMVVEEVVGSVALPVSLHNLPFPSQSASVNGVADTANLGHKDVPTHKLRSELQVCVQSQPTICNTSDAVSQSQLSSTVTTAGTSESVTCMETDHQHADTASGAVSVSLNNDTVFSVLMGWNPAVLASCPAANIESASLGDVYSPLSALKTVEPANNNSNVEVLKLPLVIEPMSDGTWQLVPMSVSAAHGANVLPDVLPNTECAIQTVAQQSELNGHSAHTFSTGSNPLPASTDLITAIDSSRLQLHSLGSLGVIGSYYNGSSGCSTGLSGAARQELSHVTNSGSCSSYRTNESCVPSSHSFNAALSSEGGASGSSILGSLGALRDYYKRIGTSIIQSSSLTATDVQILTSAVGVKSIGNSEISCTDALQSKIPAISASVSNDQVVQPVLCSEVVATTASQSSVEGALNMKPMPAYIEADEKLSLRNTSQLLPAVSVDDHPVSFDSTNKQLLSESHSNLDGSKAASAPLTDGGCEQHSCELLRHLPLKKRQKVSGDIHCEAEQNDCQHKSSYEIQDEQASDGNNKNSSTDVADILLDEKIVTQEQSVSANVAIPGIHNVRFLHFSNRIKANHVYFRQPGRVHITHRS